jgi:tetratricopeptide (TPR) repeat protein
VVPGDTVGGRFQLEQIAGLGGMGTVFRARDVTTGAPVAVKVLFEAQPLSDGRFEREAQLLSELLHPGLVRYVAHGISSTGERYLVMEWLDGEDLARRLGRARLSIEEAVMVVSRVAEALAAVHARGVVHRDLKPSNIFLVGGSLEDVRILDFGVARFSTVGATTQTGTVLGTPGYMAPEQARSGQSIDSRVDVFALGAVFFEALTGSPAFAGTHLMAMLAKILFEEAPRASDLRPEVPDTLDALVARMLAKNPDERPRDGAAVARAITSLVASPVDAPRSSRRTAPRSLTGGELRLLSVVVLGQVAGDPGIPGRVQTARPPAFAGVADRRMRDIAETRGGRFERLADGSALVTIAGTTRIAADQAAHAARCALALHAAVPARPLALATGRAAVTGRMPVGEAIDRAALLLAERGASARDDAIAIDDVTAGLLDARFDVRRGAAGFTLHGERAYGMGPRTLLGATTACVGRDREIATLNAMFVEAVEGPSAQAVLVTAPAGTGKSRLVHEALRAVRRRSEALTAEIWMGRGDSLRVGSTFGLLGQVLRAAAGVGDGEHLAVRQQKIRARVAARVSTSEQRRVAEFLGEIVGTPFPDDDSIPLRAARQDALLMGDQMRRAFEDFVRAETAAQPVIVLFEDLQWGDLPSVRFVDHALRALRDCPLMVIGVARPEVHELFPRLWEDRGVEEMRLKELSAKASERLVRQVLGDDADRATVTRVVAQAEGHAFFLEELIRAVAEGRGDALPETVRATVEARLEGLEGDARRILRAASIYGGSFSAEGVAALLGPTDRAARTEQWLSNLVDREVLVRRPPSGAGASIPQDDGELQPAAPAGGEPGYGFRHAILREAAYAMLTDGDRVLGHRLAAEWLEGRGEGDAMVLAEHLERAQLPERAGGFYLRAAQRALRGNDAVATAFRARRGLTCDVSPTVRIALLGVLCETHSWRREWAEAEPFAEEVMRLAPTGSEPWAQAAPAKLIIALRMGRIDEFLATLHLLQTVEPAPGAAGMVAFGLAAGSFILASGGRFGLSTPVLRRLEAIVRPIADRDPVARAWMEVTQAFHEAWAGEAPALALARARAAERGFREAGHTRGAAIAQVLSGMNEWFLGRLFEAERDLRATASVNDEELGLASSTRAVLLVGVLADMGALAEARLTASRIVERGRARGQAADEGRGRWLLADVLRRMGELEAAEREVSPSVELLTVSPLDQAAATATLAAVLLDRGRTAEALAAAHSAMDRYEVMGAFGYRGAFARLVLVEALEAAGETEASRDALAAAQRHLLARAAAIPDAETRRTFLHAVPENARTLVLARDRLGIGEAVALGALGPEV